MNTKQIECLTEDEMLKVWETNTYLLEPKGISQKSFYGKAKVLITDNGNRFLFSYDTLVASIEAGRLYRRWGGYSPTTLRHINSFIIGEG